VTATGCAVAASGNKTLCNCKNVSQDAVCAGIRRGLDLQGLKQTLGCGTQCGSCVPEIKRLLAATAQPVAVTS
jgi:assimilatory nitrate reductase catalytic subunit